MIGFPLQLPLEATTPRRWTLGEHYGLTFTEDTDEVSLVLQIEVTRAEISALLEHLPALIGPASFIDHDILPDDADRVRMIGGAA